MRLHILPALFILVSCTHSTAETSGSETGINPEANSPTAKEYFKDGWDNLKMGGRDLASGVSASAKSAGTSIQSIACPIAADTRLGIYYAKDSPGYEKMLSAEKSDVRECFSSEANARDKGFTLVR